MQYSNFNGAYADESIPKVERASYDIPTDIEQWKEIVSMTPVIVIYMWSDTCRPCHMIRDKFEALVHQYQNDKVLFFKDNIDLPTSFHKNQVEVVPTFFLLCDGRELDHPTYKSVFTGWSAKDVEESLKYHISQSTKFHQKEEQTQQENDGPQLYCYNNVCYLKKD
jgi:thioredoxin-like negative regulator of GroEL